MPLPPTLALALTQINNLEMLYLRNNNFSGDLPAELGSLNSNGFADLREIAISHNEFGGRLPESLGAHTMLQSLDASRNLLSGTLPTQLGGLTLLQARLFARPTHEALDSITSPTPSHPFPPPRSPRAQVLAVQHNLMEGSVPLELGHLSGLRYLQVERNLMVGGLPTQMGTMTNLITFDASENKCETIADRPRLRPTSPSRARPRDGMRNPTLHPPPPQAGLPPAVGARSPHRTHFTQAVGQLGLRHHPHADWQATHAPSASRVAPPPSQPDPPRSATAAPRATRTHKHRAG